MTRIPIKYGEIIVLLFTNAACAELGLHDNLEEGL
jgi:hypothetical protein